MSKKYDSQQDQINDKTKRIQHFIKKLEQIEQDNK